MTNRTTTISKKGVVEKKLIDFKSTKKSILLK